MAIMLGGEGGSKGGGKAPPFELMTQPVQVLPGFEVHAIDGGPYGVIIRSNGKSWSYQIITFTNDSKTEYRTVLPQRNGVQFEAVEERVFEYFKRS